MPAGRKTKLNDELCLKIRLMVLEGKTLKEIAKACKIPFDTVEGWVSRNYKGFADKWRLYKTEFRLKKAEEFGDQLMALSHTDSHEILRIKQKEAAFIRKTIGKETYSERNEITGADGGSLNINVINYGDQPST